MRLYAVAPRAAAVSRVFRVDIAATPSCRATRSLCAASCPTLPTRCAPMARALTGVQRSQPALATRPVSRSLPASAAAAFRATALARVPPNQADSPRSCRARETVLRATAMLLGSGAEPASYPPPFRACPLRAIEPMGSGAVAQRGTLPGLRGLDLAVLGRGGGDEGVEQPGRRGGDLGDGAVERLGVDPRRLGDP